MAGQHANRLIDETSPYLLQHAHNPVDWWPWGPEALEAARREDKPIFLSIGYSACHWCHVMEHESFEDEATAKVMNEHFINIKVDREERPDLDGIYMAAVQLMTQHGGWPMSVWLTPNLQPFYGGTYFPPERRHGMPAFQEVLLGVANAWKTRRGEIEDSAGKMVGHIHQMGSVEAGGDAVGPQMLEKAGKEILSIADRTWGGIGRAPKFPHSVEMRLLFRVSAKTGIDDPGKFAAFSLEKMIRGGIYDQIGGGFHRYSTDERWLAPHFEKMLYDNALLTLSLVEAFQATGRDLFRRAACETLDYVLREMTSPEGAFYSTQDADSEGVEGKFFVWTKEEILAALGPEKGEVFCYCYDVTPEGNWEHKNILNLPKTPEQCAKILNKPVEQVVETLAEGRCKLFAVRSQRIAPGRDEKILCAWNGMMIDAMAVAGSVFEKENYVSAAAKAANFVLSKMKSEGGLLYRTHKDGRSRLNAYLEDYAFLANGLVSTYEAMFDPRWIDEAIQIANKMIDQFWDEKNGGFFHTGKDHETLIVRTKDPNDNATPSGNSMAVTALARLAKITGDANLASKVDQTLSLFRGVMMRSAISTAQMLIGMGIHLGPTDEIAILGEADSGETKGILRSIHRRFWPNKVVAFASNDQSAIPLLRGKKKIDGRTTVYLCRDFTCQAPVVGAEAFQKEIEQIAK